MTPSMAVVHNNIDGRSSIGALAAWDVRGALDRGWDVTTICADLDPELAGSVRHRRLYVPPRLHLLQWSVARPTLRAALRGWRPDVLVVHQPQLAALADVWNVHYLSRAARDVRAPVPPGVKARVRDVQAAGVARLEDRYLAHLPSDTRVLFCGDGLARQFADRYGAHENAAVIYNPAPDLRAPRRRSAARRRELVGRHAGPVVGFLGGGDARKGGDLVVAAVAADPELFLLHAGPTPLDDAVLGDRARSMGALDDVGELLGVIDVLLVPSRFDPFPLVVAEAAAYGVPVLVSEVVGSAQLVAETGAGAIWRPPDSLGAQATQLAHDRARHADGARRLVDRLDRSTLADQRFAEFERVLDARAGAR